MSRIMIASLLMLGLCFTDTTAQFKDVVKDAIKDAIIPVKPKEAPKIVTGPKFALPPGIPGDVEIYFLNGSKVRMIVQSESMEVATLYGKLSVPVKDVRAIEFGLHFPEGVEAKIEAAVKALGSSDYRAREIAARTLQDLAPYSYPAVYEASRTKDPEANSRAKEIVQKLQAKHPRKDLKTMVEDRIVTNNFTIVGRILTTTIKAKTEYFGEVDLNMAKMRNLRAMGGPTLDVELGVDASKYATAGQWLDTNYVVDGRSTIVVTAKGMIDVWPQQGGQFMSNPNGFNATRNQGGVALGGGKRIGGVNQQQHCGMLLGKIGENGDIFFVGERYEGTPDHEGVFFLHIGPSQWNAQSIGTYEVKISRKQE